jgi:hypothetical protein
MARVKAGVDWVAGFVEMRNGYTGDRVYPPDPARPAATPPMFAAHPQLSAYVAELRAIRAAHDPGRTKVRFDDRADYLRDVDACTARHFPPRVAPRDVARIIDAALDMVHNRMFGPATSGGRQVVADAPVVEQLDYVAFAVHHLGVRNAPAAPDALVTLGGARNYLTAVRSCLPLTPASPPPRQSKPITVPAATGLGHLSAADLAHQYGTNADATRKHLDRWRQNRGPGDGYMENADRRENEPKYLYAADAVAPAMQTLRDRQERKAIRRTKTSVERPTR